MKKVIVFITVIVSITVIACSKKNQTEPSVSKGLTVKPNISVRSLNLPDETGSSRFIPKDSANRMIQSYLTSINYQQNDTDLRCLIVNADSLRKYLNDTSRGRITNVKLILAHTLAYVNAGGYGINAGYQTGAVTIIIAGYDQNNNYIYANSNMVLDHLSPCPYACPSGAAGGNMLQ
ncbi:MAG: hypothetical protein JSS96_11685 [Bacteroidetes bacterium]|nr:hypothetical protein [Bacteroidota bacterium]